MASSSGFSLPSTTNVLILADYNFGDPKPHTMAEMLKFKKEEVFSQRIGTLSSLKGFLELHPTLPGVKYVIVACLGPIIADAASCPDDCKGQVGKVDCNCFQVFMCVILFIISALDTVEVLGLVKTMLVNNRQLRAFIIPPLHRHHPSGFKEDVALCLVSILFIHNRLANIDLYLLFLLLF